MKRRPVAIIARTFELSAEMWKDRNIVGRLVTVALGTLHNNIGSREEFRPTCERFCYQWLKELDDDQNICSLFGRATLNDVQFKAKSDAMWSQWRQQACKMVGTVPRTGRFSIFRN